MSPTRRRPEDAPDGSLDGGHVVDIDVEEEMQGAFLEYAYSVIYSRALPDARDGLKPVQRRIVYQMADMGLRPDRGHVKSARVVGEVMGKLHPHGDGAIYDALVRMAQPFTMRLPLVDGHGNFGSLDAGPAAARYTEARPAPAAALLTAALDEDVVDTVDNYDGSLQQPEVLPAAYPNLLVNGASGIAVGMATNMAPHNLAEVVAAARHLVRHPEATTADLGRYVPGPDFPTGGIVVGLDGVREAYETGRGSFRVRGRVEVEAVTARRKGLVVTELPYGVGPERLIEKIKDAVQAKKLDGIAALTDLSDRTRGMRVVVELKSGFDPDAVLQQLYRLTPLEEAFSVNAVALVDGQPRTLGLRELLRVYVDFRLDVVRRRTAHRLQVAERDLHLVEGLLVAVLDIDEVIQLIRTSDDSGTARDRLMTVFELSQVQAEHILEMRLRRLTRFSTIELEARRDELRERIDGLRALLGSEERLRDQVADELDEVVAEHGTPRRTVLLEGDVPVQRGRAADVSLEIADEPCRVLWGATGLLARTADLSPLTLPLTARDRSRHDVMLAAVTTTSRAHVGVVTSTGRLVRLPVVDLPALPSTASPVSLSGGVSVSEAAGLAAGERVVGMVDLTAGDRPGAGPGLVTARGVVKRVVPDVPPGRDEWEVVRLADGDEVVAAFDVADDDELVIVTDDASLLRFAATAVRPQGRPAGGMAGVRLAPGARVLFAGAVRPPDPDADGSGDPGAGSAEVVLATAAGGAGQLPGSPASSVKVTPFSLYPAKGRGTGGVRAHRFLKGEDVLVAAWVGLGPVLAAGATGAPVPMPPPDARRDGSGARPAGTVAVLGGVPR
ncbi:DNA topoisomerase (ATP-hydrolyzing) subunit A [Jannaschia sp. R86511]|uniref:DNA gyrase/topoisomerase IV subunit A n=1 Tax=Jannaschia sp. R86511 TaxID=3093853 RepID=UPI0036D23784